MRREYSRLDSRSTVAGGAALATCLCSTAKYTAGGLWIGTGVVALNVHAVLALAAAFALSLGVGLRSSTALLRAITGFLLMGGGYLLAPPSTMSRHSLHTGPMLGGYLLTLVGVGVVVWAVLTAYPTTNRKAAGAASGGLGAAAGCSCCMASGAAVWLGAALGFAVPQGILADGVPFALFMSIAIGGLFVLGGRNVALLAFAGAVVAFAGDEALKALPNEIERWPRLLVSFSGMLIVFYAFARAFAAKAVSSERQQRKHIMQPAG